MIRALVGVVVVAALGAGLWAVRAETLGRDTPEDAGSAMSLLVRAAVRREPESAKLEMTRALINACRLQVDSTVAEQFFRRVDQDTFRFVLRPDLIEIDRRQLRGCIEDGRIQHLNVDVLDMATFE